MLIFVRPGLDRDVAALTAIRFEGAVVATQLTTIMPHLRDRLGYYDSHLITTVFNFSPQSFITRNALLHFLLDFGVGHNVFCCSKNSPSRHGRAVDRV